VVDDHSTDNSWEILEEYASKDTRFKIFKRPENRLPGGNAARNYAFEQSKGDYINWFDSDDVLHPDMLSEKILLFKANPDLDFVIGDIRQFEVNTQSAVKVKGLDLSQRGINYPVNYLRGNFWVGSCCPLFQREFILKFNQLFDENLQRNQEAEFFIRVLSKSQNFKFSDKSISFWRRGHLSKTKEFLELDSAERQISSLNFYKKIFLVLKNGRELEKEEFEYFKWYFGFQLESIKVKMPDFLNLIQFGLSNNIFPGRIYVSKVLLKRFSNIITKKI
jgi:glycosyltransferase involved in cell wall biosynthesis